MQHQHPGDEPQRIPPTPSPHSAPIFLKDNAVAIYTVLAVLVRIKSRVGLEAMLEYIEHYQKLIERHNPDFQVAVKAALALTDVEKIYREMIKDEI